MNKVERNEAIRNRIRNRSDIAEFGEEAHEEAEQFFEDRHLNREDEVEIEQADRAEERDRVAASNRRHYAATHRDPVREGNRARAAIRERVEERERGPDPPDWKDPSLDHGVATARWRRAHGVTDEEWARLNDIDYVSRHDDLSSPPAGLTFHDALDLATDHLGRIRGRGDADYIEELKQSRLKTKQRL